MQKELRQGHMRLIETYNSAAKVAVLNAKNRVEVRDTETCKSGLKIAVFDAKTTNEGWNPQRLVIPMLKPLFWMQKKNREEIWDL